MAASFVRLLGGALIVASVATLAVSAPELVQRIRAQASDAPRTQWAGRTVSDDSFNYRGRPLTLETTRDDTGPIVRVRWGEAAHSLPVTGLDDPRLPKLLRHKDWLRVLELTPVSGGQSPDAALAGGAESILVIAGRAPAAGYDPGTWGAVMDGEWRYTFLKLSADGGIERSEASASDLLPDTWQAAAAFAVNPDLTRSASVSATMRTLHPGKAPARDSFSGLGWTWSASGLAVMGIVVGGMLFAGSFLSRRGRPLDD